MSDPTEPTERKRPGPYTWLSEVASRLENAARAANADVVLELIHDFTVALIGLYGDNASHELIEDYCAWVAVKDDDLRAANCRKKLLSSTSDQTLDEYDRVRLIFSYISGAFGDAAYIETMTTRLEHHKQVATAKQSLELHPPPAATPLPPGSHPPPELPPGS